MIDNMLGQCVQFEKRKVSKNVFVIKKKMTF